CSASERGIRILCDYLVVHGFLTKEGNRYANTPDSAVFLDRKSPAYMGSSIAFLLSQMLTDGFKNLAAAVRKGGTVMSEHGTLAPEHPVWVEFARSMAPITTIPAAAIARLVRLEPGRTHRHAGVRPQRGPRLAARARNFQSDDARLDAEGGRLHVLGARAHVPQRRLRAQRAARAAADVSERGHLILVKLRLVIPWIA